MTELEKMKKELTTYDLQEYVNISVNLKVTEWIDLCGEIDTYRKNNPDKFLFPLECLTSKVKYQLEIENKERYDNFLKSF